MINRSPFERINEDPLTGQLNAIVKVLETRKVIKVNVKKDTDPEIEMGVNVVDANHVNIYHGKKGAQRLTRFTREGEVWKAEMVDGAPFDLNELKSVQEIIERK